MRVLMCAAGVLGMALLFGLCEGAPAAETVKSQDVRLLSEQVSLEGPRGFGKNGNMNGRGGGYAGRGNGGYCR